MLAVRRRQQRRHALMRRKRKHARTTRPPPAHTDAQDSCCMNPVCFRYGLLQTELPCTPQRESRARTGTGHGTYRRRFCAASWGSSSSRTALAGCGHAWQRTYCGRRVTWSLSAACVWKAEAAPRIPCATRPGRCGWSGVARRPRCRCVSERPSPLHACRWWGVASADACVQVVGHVTAHEDEPVIVARDVVRVHVPFRLVDPRRHVPAILSSQGRLLINNP